MILKHELFLKFIIRASILRCIWSTYFSLKTITFWKMQWWQIKVLLYFESLVYLQMMTVFLIWIIPKLEGWLQFSIHKSSRYSSNSGTKDSILDILLIFFHFQKLLNYEIVPKNHHIKGPQTLFINFTYFVFLFTCFNRTTLETQNHCFFQKQKRFLRQFCLTQKIFFIKKTAELCNFDFFRRKFTFCKKNEKTVFYK